MDDDIIQVLRVDITPNQCALQAPLSITVHYELKRPVPAAAWDLVFEADYTNKRHAIQLGGTVVGDLPPGPGVIRQDLAEIRTDGVKEKYLLQVGLIRLSLRSGDSAPLVSVNMVTQVAKDAATGALIRDIINPLE